MEKYALVTGASRGIGKSIATYLAKDGYNLYLVCHTNIELLEELSNSLHETYHVNCQVFAGNIGSSEFVTYIFQNISSLDILVNNAGISYVGLLTEMTDEDWNTVVSTNLNSIFYTSRAAAKLMLQKHSGQIINISSVWGNVGASMEVAYSATKGGVNAFTKALAKELAPIKITVNAISCGFIDTDMNNNLSEEEKMLLKNEIPADRLGQPDDIAKAVISIINSSNYLTGQIINVDGAWI